MYLVSADAVSKNPKASYNLEPIEKSFQNWLIMLLKLVLHYRLIYIESQLESIISQPEVQ